MAGQKRIVKCLVTLFFHLSIYTFMALGGAGLVLQVVYPSSVVAMSLWQFAAYVAASFACITGVYIFGGKLDRIVAAEERTREARAELLAAWRR